VQTVFESAGQTRKLKVRGTAEVQTPDKSSPRSEGTAIRFAKKMKKKTAVSCWYLKYYI